MTNLRQHPIDVRHEKHPTDPDRETVVNVRGRAVVDDPDPHAHLTPAERYALAIQRRDALVKAKWRSSEKSAAVGTSGADERRGAGTDGGDTEKRNT